MGKSVIRTSVLGLAFLLLPSLALAAGLGKLTVFSGLGQPLKAEIELLTLQKGEADKLSVRLPSQEAFRKANIDYSGALLSIKFNIEQRGEGNYVVVLSSSQAMNEPFLDLLVEVDWTTGRLVREYTFLLDPPEYKRPQARAHDCRAGDGFTRDQVGGNAEAAHVGCSRACGAAAYGPAVTCAGRSTRGSSG